MTAKEKARELMQKAYDLDQHNKTTQKECRKIALFCVDEILDNFGLILQSKQFYTSSSTVEYYNEVKKQINKL
mgnify:CR=1 FL=1|tara:strand:+ start:955 stop:1173 length:219 start_codon:yes stop_codon:yes gene_type:complete